MLAVAENQSQRTAKILCLKCYGVIGENCDCGKVYEPEPVREIVNAPEFVTDLGTDARPIPTHTDELEKLTDDELRYCKRQAYVTRASSIEWREKRAMLQLANRIERILFERERKAQTVIDFDSVFDADKRTVAAMATIEGAQ